MGSGLEAMRRETSSFYHYNHLGTALALTGADEAVSDTYRHDAWGVLLASTGRTVNPHTYVGRERYYRMPNAAMYHLGFRDYAQGVGRFTTVDPARSGWNWQIYGGNRPEVTVDPLGLQDEQASCWRECMDWRVVSPPLYFACVFGCWREREKEAPTCWGECFDWRVISPALYLVCVGACLHNELVLLPLPLPVKCVQGFLWADKCLTEMRKYQHEHQDYDFGRVKRQMRCVPVCQAAIDALVRCGMSSYVVRPKPGG